MPNKDGTRTTTTQVKAGINPNKINQLGAIRTKATKTPKGATTTNAKGGIILKPSTLVLFVVSSVITLTIAPKSLISNGSKTLGAFPLLLHNSPLSRHHNNTCNNPLPSYHQIPLPIKVL
jgi:hypothetical protein